MYDVKVEGSFEVYLYYFDKIIDRETKTTQLIEAKLRLKCLGIIQEDIKAFIIEEHIIMLLFELSQRKLCATKIVLRVKA